ncbi:ribosome maturation factor RimP [Pleionea litopenaei]|uniref:Ribosome maturation factor RimP n=1 Tax=Pleionea litopenaei TaxID=3070815 RepID=A0AA51X5T8_9GAMM|nr:ribosome maturation factor RimP [Pleionea sp. HL-JVS1]WMS86527.1 ribosome maturation factor RimP [Pleionea sp. HL-JVS1]
MAMIDELNQMIEPAVEAVGFEFVGLEYVAEGRLSVLRIFIDHPEGITVDNCADVSRQVSAILDVEDPISGNYNLEVSSPGYDRPLFKLEHFERFQGEEIKLRSHAPVDGRRNFRGILKAVEGETLTLLVDGKEFQVQFGNVDKANIVPNFDN